MLVNGCVSFITHRISLRYGFTFYFAYLGDLTNLQVLCINECVISRLPKSMAKLQKLESLHMRAIRWIHTHNVNVYVYSDFQSFIDRNKLEPYFKHFGQVCCIFS